MKRSEMELYIEQIIIEHHGYKDTNCVLANNILKAVEEAGMLPPEAYFKGTKVGCLCTMRESCPSCGGLCNEWEPEDE